MYPSRFFMMPTGFNGNYMMSRNMGFLDKLFRDVKAFNWRGLLSGASRTLTTINQTIPLIREVKPVINNVKSIMQLTKAFGRETNSKKIVGNIVSEKKQLSNKIMDDTPTFFI